jgi:hypothetical protein
MNESALQIPRFTQTAILGQLRRRVHKTADYVPPMGGNKTASTQRKRSGPSHMLEGSVVF